MRLAHLTSRAGQFSRSLSVLFHYSTDHSREKSRGKFSSEEAAAESKLVKKERKTTTFLHWQPREHRRGRATGREESVVFHILIHVV